MLNQEKKLRCPLCLKKLGTHDELIAMKLNLGDEDSTDDPVKTINCGESNIVSKLLEFGKDRLIHVENTDKLVYLSHVGCSAKSIFWDSVSNKLNFDEVSISGKISGRSVTRTFGIA